MNIRLVQIDTGGARADEVERFEVRVLLEVDGAQEWHQVSVRPNALPEFDAGLIAASDALQERLRYEQYALHSICRLVGQELRGQPVRLPQQVAA
jgi:hypothetical protein